MLIETKRLSIFIDVNAWNTPGMVYYRNYGNWTDGVWIKLFFVKVIVCRKLNKKAA